MSSNSNTSSLRFFQTETSSEIISSADREMNHEQHEESSSMNYEKLTD